MFGTFIEWQLRMITETDDSAVLVCPVCQGEGVIEKECECCGSEIEQDCELCESSGEVIFGALDFNHQKQCFPRCEYNKQLARDVIKMADWLGDPLRLTKYGFAVGSRLNLRSEVAINLKSGILIG